MTTLIADVNTKAVRDTDGNEITPIFELANVTTHTGEACTVPMSDVRSMVKQAFDNTSLAHQLLHPWASISNPLEIPAPANSIPNLCNSPSAQKR